MIPAPTNGTGRKKAAGHLRRAERAPPSHVYESPEIPGYAVYSQNHAGVRVHEENVIALATVFIGSLERAPACGECQSAVAAGQVARVGHESSMARPLPNESPAGTVPR